jgi:hypothetical protein
MRVAESFAARVTESDQLTLQETNNPGKANVEDF